MLFSLLQLAAYRLHSGRCGARELQKQCIKSFFFNGLKNTYMSSSQLRAMRTWEVVLEEYEDVEQAC